MSEYVEVTEPITTDAGTFRVCVGYDQDGVNPREDFDQLGTMVCQPSREYQVPREGDLVSMIGEAWERGGARLAVRYLSTVHNAVVLPVYGYERPTAGELGETIDNRSSIVGVIYALRSDIEAEWVGSGNPMPTDAEIAGWLAGEVTTYAAWATGEMFGYVIERLADGCEHDDDDCECWGDTGESCWGYYSVDEAMDMGREVVPTERELTDVEWLAQMFEFELCAECGRDADSHTVGLDPLGNRHAICTASAALCTQTGYRTGYLAIDLDLVTEVEARDVYPNSWVEAHPLGVTDEGDIGGDIQAGNAWSRRFVRWMSDTGRWAVVTDSFYLAKCDHDDDQHETDVDGETHCKHCGPVSWIQNQTEFTICADFRDPGSAEEYSDTEYDNTSGDFDWQITDDYAKWCAARLRADAYGDPANWRR